MNDKHFKDIKMMKEYLRNKKRIGNDAYLIDEEMVVKIYDEEYKKNYNDLINRENLLKFKDISIDGVSFVLGLIYVDEEIVGEISRYSLGKSGKDKHFGDIPIDKLILALGKIKSTIRELSDRGIVINDPYYENIIFDGEKFVLIDMAEASYCDNDKEIIYRDNMINIVYEILQDIFVDTGIHDQTIYGYLKLIDSKYKNFLYEDDYFMLEPDELIKNIVLEMEINLGIKINNLNELDKYIRETIFKQYATFDKKMGR